MELNNEGNTNIYTQVCVRCLEIDPYGVQKCTLTTNPFNLVTHIDIGKNRYTVNNGNSSILNGFAHVCI